MPKKRRGGGKAPGRGPSGEKALLEGELATTWEQLSESVLQARCAGMPGAMNETLRAQGKSPLAAAFTLWTGDNHALEMRYDDAAQAYEETLRADPAKVPGADNVHVAALEQLAWTHERSERFDEATSALQRLIKRGGGDAVRGHDRMGMLAERRGDDKAAIAAYRRAAKIDAGPHLLETRERARRDAARLLGDRAHLRATAEALADELARALRRGDMPALRRLASPTHFSLGVIGGHQDFRDPAEILARVEEDLTTSTTRADGARLTGCGDKRTLATEGWSGTWFPGTVSLTLVRTPRGWEWRGLATHGSTGRAAPDFEPAKRETNQPLSIPIKSPWPAGRFFTAGGNAKFAGELATVIAIGFIPFAGPFLAMDETKRLASRPAGFGPGGYYYNTSPTHLGFDAFAIDFSSYRRNVPYSDAAGGTPLLAVQEGFVARATGSFTSGDPTSANEVWVDHMFRIMIPSYGTFFFPTPYQSRSMHLAGPGLVPVSVGMFVRQGARLGVMDDTGNSTQNHLHFSMRDATLMGGMSVRPTPMDGWILGDADDGRVVGSTNVPFP